MMVLYWIRLLSHFLVQQMNSESTPKHLTKILQRIRRAEEVQRGYAKLRHLLKRTQATLVTQIEIPSDNSPPKEATSWTCLTDPEEVTNQLFQRNIKHFGSAHGTPFTVPPLSTQYDWAAQSPYHTQTLNNNPPYTDDPLLSKLLSHLHSRVSPTRPTLTMPELIKRLRQWKIHHHQSLSKTSRTLQITTSSS